MGSAWFTVAVTMGVTDVANTATWTAEDGAGLPASGKTQEAVAGRLRPATGPAEGPIR